MHQLKDSTNKEKEDMIVLYQVKLFKKVHRSPHCKPMTPNLGSAFELSV
jgi:hypothetical protein